MDPRVFLEALFGTKPKDAYVLLWSKSKESKASTWHRDLDEASEAVAAGARAGDIYVGAGLAREPLGSQRRARAADIMGIPGFWLDLDVAGPGHAKANLPPDKTAALRLLGNLELEPTVVVDTGGGFHAWWLLSSCWVFADDLERDHAAALSAAWQGAIRSRAATHGWALDSTHDLARVLRIPGTLNHKHGLAVVLHSADGPRHEVSDFERVLPDAGADMRPRRTVASVTLHPRAEPPADKLDALLNDHPRFRSTWEKERLDLPSQSEFDLALASMAAGAGWTDQEVATLIVAHRRRHGQDLKLREDYLSRTISRARVSASQQPRPQLAQEERQRLDDLVARAKAERRTDIVLEGAELIARLPTAEYSTLKAQLKHVLGSALNLNDLDRAVKEARAQPRVPEPGDHPSIIVSERHLREVSDDALGALRDANTPPRIFVRGNALVRVQADEHGQPAVQLLRDAHVKGHLTRVADFWRRGGATFVPASPPEDVVRDILTRGGWPFPALVGIAEAPIVRPDGSVRTDRGYDASTSYLYWPDRGLSLAQVAEHPTRDDVAAALTLLLDELLGDFPFGDAASKANALALMLTPLLRPAFEAPVPLALITAPRPGTGKTYLAQLIGAVATGRILPMTSAPQDDEEWRKRLTSTLAAGWSVVVIDNVEGGLESPALATALTTTSWTDRVLGRSEMVTLPQRATWIATGNDLRVKGDLPRRCYLISLDAQRGRPWQRGGFRRTDLLGWAVQERGRLLGALITLIRFWTDAGRPSGSTPTVAGYDTWKSTAGGVVIHAGVPGFLGNLDALYTHAEGDTHEWEAFLAAWLNHFGEKAVTAGTVADALRVGGALATALPDDLAQMLVQQGVSFERRLGKALARREGITYGPGLRVRRGAGESRSGSVLWRVQVSGVSEVSHNPTGEGTPPQGGGDR